MLPREIRTAFRLWNRHRRLALVLVASIGIGTGTTAAVFAFADAVMFRALPFANVERLAVLQQLTLPGAGAAVRRSDVDLLRERAASIEAIGLMAPAPPLNLAGAGESEELGAVTATPEAFALLDATPRVGRL